MKEQQKALMALWVLLFGYRGCVIDFCALLNAMCSLEGSRCYAVELAKMKDFGEDNIAWYEVELRLENART